MVKKLIIVIICLLTLIFSVNALYNNTCWKLNNYGTNGLTCINGTATESILTGVKIDWSNILNPQTGNGTGNGTTNNYYNTYINQTNITTINNTFYVNTTNNITIYINNSYYYNITYNITNNYTMDTSNFPTKTDLTNNLTSLNESIKGYINNPYNQSIVQYIISRGYITTWIETDPIWTGDKPNYLTITNNNLQELAINGTISDLQNQINTKINFSIATNGTLALNSTLTLLPYISIPSFDNSSIIRNWNTSWKADTLSQLQTTVSNDFHNLGGTDLTNTTSEIRNQFDNSSCIYLNLSNGKIYMNCSFVATETDPVWLTDKPSYLLITKDQNNYTSSLTLNTTGTAIQVSIQRNGMTTLNAYATTQDTFNSTTDIRNAQYYGVNATTLFLNTTESDINVSGTYNALILKLNQKSVFDAVNNQTWVRITNDATEKATINTSITTLRTDTTTQDLNINASKLNLTSQFNNASGSDINVSGTYNALILKLNQKSVFDAVNNQTWVRITNDATEKATINTSITTLRTDTTTQDLNINASKLNLTSQFNNASGSDINVSGNYSALILKINPVFNATNYAVFQTITNINTMNAAINQTILRNGTNAYFGILNVTTNFSTPSIVFNSTLNSPPSIFINATGCIIIKVGGSTDATCP